MLETLKQSWHHFKEAAPGERFEQHFKRQQQARRSAFRKILFIGGGLLIMAAGLFFLPAPGPGMIILFIGAAMVAQESFVAARALDWTEVQVRRLAAWSKETWRRAPVLVRILLVVVAMALLAVVGFGAYKLLFEK